MTKITLNRGRVTFGAVARAPKTKIGKILKNENFQNFLTVRSDNFFSKLLENLFVCLIIFGKYLTKKLLEYLPD